MMTNAASTSGMPTPREGRDRAAMSTTQKVVVVNGNEDVLSQFETVLEAGHYDVVFVESTDHAYSQIKRVQPNLVILCVNVEEPAGFRLLSMLNLDKETREIPILTFTTEYAEGESTEEVVEPADNDLFPPLPAISMN